MTKNKILIAGGTGLVGSNLSIKLADIGLPYVATKNKAHGFIQDKTYEYYDFRNFNDCLMATKDKTAVVLCAAISYGAKKNKELPTQSILPNLKIGAGLLEASAINKVKTVILLSSSTIYQPADFLIRERDLDLNQSPFSGYFGVGWTHRYMEQLSQLYAEIYGMTIAVLRPTNIFGPFDKFDKDRSHVIPSLIRRALNQENPFEVWGSPDVVRDFIFVEDLVDDIVEILNNSVNVRGLPVNICSGSPITIKKACEIILNVCNHKTNIYFNRNQPTAIPYRAVDNSRYTHIFGDKKRTPFSVGIKKTLNWYIQNIK